MSPKVRLVYLHIYENTIILRPDDIDPDKSFFILQHADGFAEEAVAICLKIWHVF